MLKSKSKTVQKLKEKFNFDEWVKWLKSSKQRHIRIIGAFAEDVKPDIRSYEQGEVYLKMNLRAAKDLSYFSDEQLQNALERMLEANYLKKKDMLATLKKYIF